MSFTKIYTKEADNSEIESVEIRDASMLPFVSVMSRSNETLQKEISSVGGTLSMYTDQVFHVVAATHYLPIYQYYVHFTRSVYF